MWYNFRNKDKYLQIVPHCGGCGTIRVYTVCVNYLCAFMLWIVCGVCYRLRDVTEKISKGVTIDLVTVKGNTVTLTYHCLMYIGYHCKSH